MDLKQYFDAYQFDYRRLEDSRLGVVWTFLMRVLMMIYGVMMY